MDCHKALSCFHWPLKTHRLLFSGLEYGAQLVPPNFSHQVSFSRRQFSLARLFFFGTTFFWHDFFFSGRLFFFGTTFFFRHFFFFSARLVFFRHDFLFSARPGQVTADQYYCSGMEHMVIATVAQFNSAT